MCHLHHYAQGPLDLQQEVATSSIIQLICSRQGDKFRSSKRLLQQDPEVLQTQASVDLNDRPRQGKLQGVDPRIPAIQRLLKRKAKVGRREPEKTGRQAEYHGAIVYLETTRRLSKLQSSQSWRERAKIYSGSK